MVFEAEDAKEIARARIAGPWQGAKDLRVSKSKHPPGCVQHILVSAFSQGSRIYKYLEFICPLELKQKGESIPTLI